ncbi:hypothetical protein D3C76_1624770 [compost metagenome]
MKEKDKEQFEQSGTGIHYPFQYRAPSLLQEGEQQAVIFIFHVDDSDVKTEQDDERQQDP